MIVRSPATAVAVLQMMSEGKSNPEIGRIYGVTAWTVEKYMRENLYPMLGCTAKTTNKRAEAVGRAFRLQILN